MWDLQPGSGSVPATFCTGGSDLGRNSMTTMIVPTTSIAAHPTPPPIISRRQGLRFRSGLAASVTPAACFSVCFNSSRLNRIPGSLSLAEVGVCAIAACFTASVGSAAAGSTAGAMTGSTPRLGDTIAADR